MWLYFKDTFCFNANCGYRKECKLSMNEVQSSLYKLYIFRLHLRMNQLESPCFALTQIVATKLDHILRCCKIDAKCGSSLSCHTLRQRKTWCKQHPFQINDGRQHSEITLWRFGMSPMEDCASALLSFTLMTNFIAQHY